MFNSDTERKRETDRKYFRIIVQAITDALIWLNICQTYDGASDMMGKKSGVAEEIIKLQPKALAKHCHCHSLNLSVKRTTEQCQLLTDIPRYGTRNLYTCEIFT